MGEKCNVENSRSLQSYKSPLQKKKNCSKNQEKSNGFVTDNNADLELYSYGYRADAVKVMIRSIF